MCISEQGSAKYTKGAENWVNVSTESMNPISTHLREDESSQTRDRGLNMSRADHGMKLMDDWTNPLY